MYASTESIPKNHLFDPFLGKLHQSVHFFPVFLLLIYSIFH